MNLALFDFDGTITTSDTWTPFLRLASRPTRMLAGHMLLAPVVIGYRLGLVSASRARQTAARVAFRGEVAAEVRRRGEEYARTTLPATVRPAALERIAWHAGRGDHVVVVSASLDVYLAPWCAAHGVDCICTALEVDADKLTGRYVGRDCTGPEKARRIRERFDLDRFDEIYAYGDSLEDREMLELAHKKFFGWQRA